MMNHLHHPYVQCPEPIDSPGELFCLQRITEMHSMHSMLRGLWRSIQDRSRDETHSLS